MQALDCPHQMGLMGKLSGRVHGERALNGGASYFCPWLLCHHRVILIPSVSSRAIRALPQKVSVDFGERQGSVGAGGEKREIEKELGGRCERARTGLGEREHPPLWLAHFTFSHNFDEPTHFGIRQTWE